MTDWLRLCDIKDLRGKFSAVDLDRIASSYDPAFHESPLTAGFPREDSESYGWIQGPKREGQSLYAKFRQFVPAVVRGLQDGLYKRHSISIYRNLNGRGPYLRHFAFAPAAEVGGTPPVMVFSEDKFSSFTEFEFYSNQGASMKTAEQMLKSIVNFSESESDELSRKIERARQQVKREFTTGPVVPAVGIEESIAAQVLADEQKIPFGRALAQVKGGKPRAVSRVANSLGDGPYVIVPGSRNGPLAW